MANVVARRLRLCRWRTSSITRLAFPLTPFIRPVSGGGLNLYPDLGFGFLWAGGTVPDGRGRGAYRALLGARVQAARDAGLRAVGLYARVNTSPRAREPRTPRSSDPAALRAGKRLPPSGLKRPGPLSHVR